MKPVIAVTMGDPAGVGPEIAARVWRDKEVHEACHLRLVGRKFLLTAGALAAGLPEPEAEVVETGQGGRILFGQPSADGGRQAMAFIEKALDMCVKGEAHAMVTGPINKHCLQQAGSPDTGHTTMLARLTNTPNPLMMLAGEKLKVILATIHVAYADVPGLLSIDSLVEKAALAHREMGRLFGLERPRLAVAALNPHAGEDGIFGDEESRIIGPAVARMKELGIDASGPWPGDTVFWRAANGDFDLVLCMYHDQGLIPLKLLHFEDGVNVTLGLPIIRTSVDHGTAFDIAGKGVASEKSLKAAIMMAVDMARRRS